VHKIILIFSIVISRLSSVGSCNREEIFVVFLKADSHIECRAHAVPMPRPCRSPAIQCR